MGGGDRRGPPPRPIAPSPRDGDRRQRPPDGAEMRPRTPFGNPRRGPVMAPIEHNDQVVAVVWVPPLTGLRRVADEIGTPLAIGALLLLIGGTVVAALVIFRPAQARLSAVEEAARRFGEGDLSARAPEMGGDEVAAVADRVQSHGRRSCGPAGAAGRGRPRAPSAARRRLTRVDDAADRDSRLRRNARRCRSSFLRRKEGQRAVKVIHEEGERIERLVGICSTSRASRPAAFRSRSRMSTSTRSSSACRSVTRRRRRTRASRSWSSRTTTTFGWSAIRIGSSRPCRTSPSNALRHTPPGGAVRLGASRDDGKVKLTRRRQRRRHPCRSTCRTSSIVSTRPISHDRKRDRASACRS